MKITTIAKSKALTTAKLKRLTELASRLGKLRTEIWNEFGSIKGVNLTHRQIRDNWLSENKSFNVPARLWKETLRDVIDDIHLYCEAAKEKVRKAIAKRYTNKKIQKAAYSKLKSGDSPEIGVDKGYSEVFVDSEAEVHGEGLGSLLSAESDRLNVKYQRRNKLRSIADKKPHKAAIINKHNLGRQKLDKRKAIHKARVKKLILKAVHSVVDKAKEIVCEDLTATFQSSKPMGKNQKRRLSGWVKGIIADALEQVSLRRGASVIAVNAAYTSQACSSCGCLGRRSGDAFYCINTGCGVVLQADRNAAVNIKLRKNDPEIGRWMPFSQVKSILLERSRQRLGLLNQDSRYLEEAIIGDITSAHSESELPNVE